GDDILDFLAKLRLYLQNQDINLADNAAGPPTGRKVAMGYLRGYRRANYRPEELHRKFLDALPLPWLEKAKDISEHLLLDELAKKLFEIELRQIARHKRDRIPDPLIYFIKSEKPQQALYIVDQEGNYMDPLTQDLNFHKYLEQAKALFKKPQQQNHSVRMDRIESKVDEIGQMTSQFGRMMLDNQSKKP
ncbi:44480_t:CDS:2, partial [Gigaspora margarita]